MNDLFSATAVIDRLGAMFEELLCRRPQQSLFTDENDLVRLTARRIGLRDLLYSSFGVIRQSAINQPLILAGLADVITKLAVVASSEEQRLLLEKVTCASGGCPVPRTAYDR